MVFKVPADHETIVSFGASLGASDGLIVEPRLAEALPEVLNLLVWNLFKGQGYKKKSEVHFWQDLKLLAESADLHLWQEMLFNQVWQKQMEMHLPKMRVSFASSFQYRNNTRTGVATASVVKPIATKHVRGSEREFFFLTPKVSLISEFLQKHSSGVVEKILVINTHVVNFTTTRSFVSFIDELLDVVQNHRGPLILAGDFNTWNFNRWHSILKILARLDIFPLEFSKDPRILKLDHVFVRGYQSLAAEIQNDVRSSDHFPIQVKLKLS